MHTSDDPADIVSYSIYQAIDRARELAFDVLAITYHSKVAFSEAYARYAEARGILLISGIELSLNEYPAPHGRHVLLLGASPDAESIRTYDELRAYRSTHPDTIVIAPHPYFYGNFSLHGDLERHIDLFDAIELSWFYGGPFDRNARARDIATKYSKPLVATSDTHMLDHLEHNYSLIHAHARTERAIFDAVRSGLLSIHTRPSRLFSEMIVPQALFSLRTLVARWLGLRHQR